jgi:hypothetical protein
MPPPAMPAMRQSPPRPGPASAPPPMIGALQGRGAPPAPGAMSPAAMERPPRPTEAAPMPPEPPPPLGAPPMAGYGGGAPAPMGPPEGAMFDKAAPAKAPRKQEVGLPQDAKMRRPVELERERGIASAGAAPVSAGSSAYLIALARLAAELDAQGRGRADAAAIRVLRQRLTEWVEDVRSVGGQDALADAVERLVQRLSAALAAGTALASEAVAIATELAAYAAGGTPPSAPKQGRAFWK